MSDWADRKEQRLISKAGEEERERQIRSQVLASARPFWEEMLESMEKSKDAWNLKRGVNEMVIHQASGPPDSLSLIVRGRDDEVSIRLDYNVPQIKYTTQSSHESGTLQFAIDHDEVRVFNRRTPATRLSSTQAADLFLDQVVRG